MHKFPLTMLLLMLFAAGCKKNGQEQLTPESDIQYRVFHQTFSVDSSSLTLDIDSNGSTDLVFSVWFYTCTTCQPAFQNTALYMDCVSGNSQMQKTPVTFHYPNMQTHNFYLPDWYAGSGGLIDTAGKSWNTEKLAIYAAMEYLDISKAPQEAISVPKGETGYYVIRLLKHGDYYYGWVQMRMGADGKSFEVIDAAVARKPGMFIRIGQKQ